MLALKDPTHAQDYLASATRGLHGTCMCSAVRSVDSLQQQQAQCLICTAEESSKEASASCPACVLSPVQHHGSIQHTTDAL